MTHRTPAFATVRRLFARQVAVLAGLGMVLAGLAVPALATSTPTAQTVAAAALANNPDVSVPGFDEDAFRSPTSQKPAVLWFWNRTQTNAQVDATLESMRDAGFTETVIFRWDAEQYFSAAWFDRVEHTLRKSQELGMTVWLDNDSQFPSGAAAGLIVNGGTVGSKTYPARKDLRVKSAYRAGSSVVTGGGPVDLKSLFGTSIRSGNGQVIADATSLPGITLLKAGAAWTNYEVDAKFTIDSATAGFMVRSTDVKNGYLIDVRADGKVDVWKQVNGAFQVLRVGSTTRPGWNPTAEHAITIKVDGPSIGVTIDGVAEPALSDSTFPGGRVGMRVDGSQKWRLDELAVKAVPDGASLYQNDFSSQASVGDFDVASKPVENIIAVTARPASGADATNPDAVIDLSADYADDGVWQAPAGSWRTEAFAYRLKMDNNYADTLDPEAQELYNQIIMDEYQERFPWAFGTVLKGFADDESEVSVWRDNAVPWTPALTERLAGNGTTTAKAMVSLFNDLGRKGDSQKSSFYRAVSDQWVDAYWKPKYDWAEDHDIAIISNPLWDEHGPAETVRYSGNLMTMHQWAQVPGTDLIFNDVGNGAARILPRTSASVAHQLGRPLVYDELMGGAGWDRSLDDVRQAAGTSALRGINYATYHATYDSVDGIPFPPIFSDDNTWWPWMDDVNTWTGRLMEFGRHKTAARTAILQMQRSNEAGQRTDGYKATDADYTATMHSLEDSQVDFDILDEGALTGDPQVLAQAEVDGGSLKVGEMSYTSIVVPKAPYLSLDAAKKLKAFVAAGGEVVWAGPAPLKEIDGHDDQLAEVVADISTEGGSRVVKVSGASDAGGAAAGLGQAAVTLSKSNSNIRALRFQEGKTGGYLLLNEGRSAVTVDVTFPTEGVPALWDPETGDIAEASTYRSGDGRTTVPMTLVPKAPTGVTVSPEMAGATHATKVTGGGAVDKVSTQGGAVTATVSTEKSGTTAVRATDGTSTLSGSSTTMLPDAVDLDGDWTMALDNGSNPVTRALKSWSDIAPSYSGSATYTRNVTLTQEQLTGLDWKLDLGTVANVAEVTVNGHKIGDRIWPPYSIALGDALDAGENTVSVRVTNTMANAKSGSITSGLLGPVALRPSVTREVPLTSTSLTASEATANMNSAGTAADVTLKVENAGDTPVTGTVTVDGPTGWTSKRSSPMTISAGGSATGTAHIFPGGFQPDDGVSVRASFTIDGSIVANDETTLATSFPTPPAASSDHVDLGDAASESAHNLKASPTSGTNTEAGLTRRYGGYRVPDAWYEFDLAVKSGKPFAIQGLETYDDNPQDKSYRIFVDGTLVGTRLNVRPLRKAGTASYRFYVPAKYVTSDQVTVRFQSRTDPDFADPSLADVWALTGVGDVTAPTVEAGVLSDKIGDNGWYRGPAAVVVSAEDDRDESPVVETGTDDGWQSYTSPVPVAGDAKHTVYYRAKDAAGNSSGTKEQDVWIDSTAPATQVSAVLKGGIDESDRATLTLAAHDALSGVATTSYRIDGGEWNVLGDVARVVEGYGEHTVEYFSTDVAGNDEGTGSLTLSLADVDTIEAIIAPQVTGSVSYGSTLTATTGSWNTKGLTYAYQWLRDGEVVVGRTAATYKIGSSDIGHRLSVRVTASKDGKAPGVSTSEQTAKVTKARSKVAVGYSDTSVRKNQSVRLSIAVSSITTTPRGTVRIYENGRRVKSLTLSSTGKVSYSMRMRTKGLRSVKVVYAGSSTVSASTSSTRYIRVR